ncbi:MAG: dependent protein [Chloroflexota bacterium]|nr:dependent protein [Chloroflexota bacterium]
MSAARGVADRLKLVRERIADAAARSGRSPAAVTLVGVSKGHIAEEIADAVAAGLQDVGENRVQEAAAKIPEVERLAGAKPHWHLVGHLQSNKTKAALQLFDTIQSVDSVRIAQALSRLATHPLPVFLEVQFAAMPDRFGFAPDEVREGLEAVAALPNVQVTGLMTVAPLGLDEAGTRAVFRTLRACAARIDESYPDQPPLQLSMGMTDDYVTAIEEGATLVRIGRAIFAESLA